MAGRAGAGKARPGLWGRSGGRIPTAHPPQRCPGAPRAPDVCVKRGERAALCPLLRPRFAAEITLHQRRRPRKRRLSFLGPFLRPPSALSSGWARGLFEQASRARAAVMWAWSSSRGAQFCAHTDRPARPQGGLPLASGLGLLACDVARSPCPGLTQCLGQRTGPSMGPRTAK